MLAAGAGSFAVVAAHPWQDLLAFLFGVGAGLVLDEFALLLHLQDVYWSEQGRSSIDAVIVAVGLTGMLLVRARRFGLGDIGDAETPARWLVVLTAAVNLGLTAVTRCTPPAETLPGHQRTCAGISRALVRMTPKPVTSSSAGWRPVATICSW